MPVINSVNEKGKTEKKPTIKDWPSLRLPRDKDRIRRAFLLDERVNAIGLLTGKVNNLFVLDVDPGADLTGRPIEPTVTVKTGRGKHFYFKYDSRYGNSVGGDSALDTRSDGGFVVVPPSWHNDGVYEWVVDYDEDLLADIPDWLKDELGEKKNILKQVTFGTKEGSRNHSAASVIGHVLHHLHEDLWEDFGWQGLRHWNKRNKPPLSEDELYKVFISIAKREMLRREGYGKTK